jgi:hypothetical protein
MGLAQLKKDWLLIYGIFDHALTQQEQEFRLDDIEEMNYLQIANFFIINSRTRQGNKSILSLIRRVKCSGYFDSIKVSLCEEDLQL